jgi:hypothetical protein
MMSAYRSCLNAEWLSRTIALPYSDSSKKLNAIALPDAMPDYPPKPNTFRYMDLQ